MSKEQQPELLNSYGELYSKRGSEKVDTIIDSMLVEPSLQENITDPVVTVAANNDFTSYIVSEKNPKVASPRKINQTTMNMHKKLDKDISLLENKVAYAQRIHKEAIVANHNAKKTEQEAKNAQINAKKAKLDALNVEKDSKKAFANAEKEMKKVANKSRYVSKKTHMDTPVSVKNKSRLTKIMDWFVGNPKTTKKKKKRSLKRKSSKSKTAKKKN